MKKYISCLLLATMFGFTFCTSPLEEKLYSSQNIDDFYQNKAQADLALSGIYSVLWSGYIYKDGKNVAMGDFPGETMMAYRQRDENDLFAWTISSPQFQNLWSACYQGIDRANQLIDRISKSSVTDDTKNDAIGQAKFLRALFYFNLVKAFGGVPLHITATSNISDVSKPRGTVDEVYAQIISDLKDSETKLSPFNASKHAAGYATSGAAKALLAKVFLQHREWSNAAAKAKEVIDLKVYDLIKDYAQIWDPAKKNGSEQIFSIQHNNGGDSNSSYGEHMVYWFCPPGFTLNGNSIQFAKDGSTFEQVEPEFYNSTPNTYRKWQTMRDRMPKYLKLGTTTWISDTVKLDGIYLVKYYFPDYATGYLQTGVNFTILRYSDVLLTYAEALNEANSSPTAEAYAAINKVRQRARAVGTTYEQPASIYPDLAGLTKDQFRKAILDERAAEFIGEGERRNDLNRYDLLISKAAGQGISNIKPGYVLFPIPVNEIKLNPLLIQNQDY